MGTSVELQAVIMAGGKGSRMTELTARRAKCLLPIGNMPMIFYPIQLLERSGFLDVIIVVLESSKSEVQASLEKCGLKIKFELVSIPNGEDWGTADSLRFLEESNKIKTDVLVISCDLITDVSLAPLLNIYRTHDSAVTAMFVKTGPIDSVLPTPGPKSKNKIERDFVGINKDTSRLVLLASASDYEEILPLNCNLLRKYGQFTIHSKLLDAHVYIISKWLCEYLVYNRTLSTLKGEVLPFVVKKHLTPPAKISPSKFEDKASIIGADIKTGIGFFIEISQFAQENDLTHKVRLMSSYTDNKNEKAYVGDSIRCYAYVFDNDAYALRANTLQQYCLVNRQIQEHWSTLTNGRELVNVSPNATISSTQLDLTCVVADKATIAEKTSLKTTMVGTGVNVEKNTLIKDSIIMAGVTIEQRCVIENCIICEGSFVGNTCKLKDCIVGSHHKVVSESNHSNEVLTDDDRLMEI